MDTARNMGTWFPKPGHLDNNNKERPLQAYSFAHGFPTDAQEHSSHGKKSSLACEESA